MDIIEAKNRYNKFSGLTVEQDDDERKRIEEYIEEVKIARDNGEMFTKSKFFTGELHNKHLKQNNRCRICEHKSEDTQSSYYRMRQEYLRNYIAMRNDILWQALTNIFNTNEENNVKCGAVNTVLVTYVEVRNHFLSCDKTLPQKSIVDDSIKLEAFKDVAIDSFYSKVQNREADVNEAGKLVLRTFQASLSYNKCLMELMFKAEKIPQRSKTILGFDRNIEDGLINSKSNNNNNNNHGSSHKSKPTRGTFKTGLVS